MKLYMLLFFLSLAFAEITSVALSIDGSHAVESTGISESNTSIGSHFKRKNVSKFCGRVSDCAEDETCQLFVCVQSARTLTKSDSKNEGKCKTDKNCGDGVKCMSGFCIDRDVTAEASATGDAMCHKDKDCDSDSKCLSGLCLASSKFRFARRSPQLICHTDRDCASPSGPGHCAPGGICVAPPIQEVEARSPQVQCHTDQDCASPSGPGKCIAGGICIAPPRQVKARSPPVQCHTGQDCASPDGPGYCIDGGNCVADPPSRALAEAASASAGVEVESRSPKGRCRGDNDCSRGTRRGKCTSIGLCIKLPHDPNDGWA
ncbi:hypothetical protein BDW68DRAFT_174002 [Aspergillus falconensis]